MALELVGLTAAFLILAASWPQLREVLQAGTQGVSLGSWSMFLSAAVVWATYGWKIGSPSTVIGNVAGALAFSVLVTAIVAARTSLRVAIPSVFGAIAALLTTSVLLPTPVVGALGVAIGFTLAIPQIVVSWRTRGMPSTVSRTAWGMVAIGQSLWLLYGLLLPDIAITVVNIVALSASVTVLLLERGRPTVLTS
jgi:MtN3 and saliva related transmembrane protein